MGDGTHSTRPTPAAESTRRSLGAEAASRAPATDLQDLVVRALARLLAETGCARGAVWWRDPDQGCAALAGLGDATEPDAETLGALLALGVPTDLGDPALPAALARLAARSGLAAAAAVGEHGRAVSAVVLLGGVDDPAGAVRPRTLAALGAAARRLEAPVTTARGALRLAALDSAVQRLDRLSSLGELVAEIVHEIRNPLVSVKTFLQLLPERGDDAEFMSEFHEVATEELRRVERLLDLVLAHGRPSEAERPEPGAPLGDAVGSVTQLVAHRAAQAGVALDAAAPAETLRVALGEDALRQVLLNLVMNALDATPAGGTVHIRSTPGDTEVRVRIEDEGPGVPPELRERIFEPFVTTHAGRTGGLGLAISRRLAERAGGTLRLVDDTPGGCFELRLPRAPDGT